MLIFRAEHAPEPQDLTLRLEQRLGIPPGSNDVAFVELQIVDLPRAPFKSAPAQCRQGPNQPPIVKRAAIVVLLASPDKSVSRAGPKPTKKCVTG